MPADKELHQLANWIDERCEAFPDDENLYRALSEASHDAIFLIDKGRSVCYVNAFGAAFLGASIGDIKGKHLRELFPPPAYELQSRAIEHVFESGEPFFIEENLSFAQRDLWIDTRLMPIKDKHGSVRFVMGVSRDITGQKIAQEELREKEEKVRLLLDSTGEGIYGIDGQNNCTFCNSSCLRLLGYKNPEELIGKNMHLLIHHSHKDGTPYNVGACRIFQAFLRGEGVHIDDEVLWRADGSSFHAEILSFPQQLNGKIVGAVVTFMDITERKRAEEALRESEARFRALFNTMAEGVAVHEIIYNEKGEASDYLILEVNSAYEALTGITTNEAKGKKASELYGTGKPPYFDIYAKVAETGQPHDFVTYFGPVKKYFRISAFSPANGRFATVFDDITESRKNEEEREKLYLELKDALGKVKVLSGMLPICASCKKIRDDEGYWNQIEAYISKHSEVLFSHGICPDCIKKLYPTLKFEK